VLREHPAIVDVAAAGVPDAEMGERVGVAIVARGALSADDVKAYCRERLAIYKTPEYVVFVDELPYSETGKVVRRRLVELLESQLERTT
jgi:acyl-CoA synthetase (AMP-forming)/AMP-acid ligase II